MASPSGQIVLAPHTARRVSAVPKPNGIEIHWPFPTGGFLKVPLHLEHIEQGPRQASKWRISVEGAPS